jgi:hypothetical protein
MTRGSMHNFNLVLLLSTTAIVLIAGCSKSPVDAGVQKAQSAVKQDLAPLNPKDASAQAERMVALIANRPECDLYRDLLHQAGRGPPTAGTTQLDFVGAYDAASKAGCVKAGK